MPLSLRILGVPLLQRVVGGVERELHVQAKRLALLSFLAVHRPPGWCRREALVTLFWAESDERSARNAANQAIHQLRLALGNSVVTTRGNDEIRLSPGRLWCDAVGFQDALADGRWEDARRCGASPGATAEWASGTGGTRGEAWRLRCLAAQEEPCSR